MTGSDALADLKTDLRFYFITDDSAPGLSALRQAEIAVSAGATVVQYRNKRFSPAHLPEALAVRKLCSLNSVVFIVNDDIVLAQALRADGVHLGQKDSDPALARKIMGGQAVIGVSVSTPDELERTDIIHCDYIGTGPVFNTGTKEDAKPVIGTKGLADVVGRVSLPVVAIGGITAREVQACFKSGAAGVAVISAIARAADPAGAARSFGTACGTSERQPAACWENEFSLIRRILSQFRVSGDLSSRVEIGPGDDAALFKTIKMPVITTDAQREDVHFRRRWQSMDEIGYKAAEITFSDLAASYASPVALFVNLALPDTVTEDDVAKLYAGIGESISAHGAVLGGGNISSSRALGLDLFAVGEGYPGLFPVRSAARPGYGLYATGRLGLARAGLDCLVKGDKQFPELIRAFKFPRARFDAAFVLAEHGVECAMDISDGLAGDAGHIAEASGLTIKLDLTAGSVPSFLAGYCEKYGKSAEHVMAAGGEDYELLFACPPEVFEDVRQKLPEAFQVGRCISYDREPVQGIPEGVRGYRHGEGG